MANEERRRNDDIYSEKVLESLNLLHTKMEVLTQVINGEIKRDIAEVNKDVKRHEISLYDKSDGIVNIVNVVNDRVKTHSRILWGIGGAIVTLLIDWFKK